MSDCNSCYSIIKIHENNMNPFLVNVLILYSLRIPEIPQNSQTLSHKSSATADELFECV